MQGLVDVEPSDFHWLFVPKNLFYKFRHSKTANVRPLRAFWQLQGEIIFTVLKIDMHVSIHIQRYLF